MVFFLAVGWNLAKIGRRILIAFSYPLVRPSKDSAILLAFARVDCPVVVKTTLHKASRSVGQRQTLSLLEVLEPEEGPCSDAEARLLLVSEVVTWNEVLQHLHM